MADKQLSLKQDADDRLFADDDPLAALARIASFEPQGETRPKPSAQRREPEFNLEDELLKEFEQYEEPAAPVVAPEIHAEQEAVAEPGLFAGEPTFDAPAFDADGTYDSQTVFGDEAPAAAPILTVEPEAPVRPVIPELRVAPEPSFVGPSEPIRPAAHPVFDLEDEILKEFAAFDARRSTQNASPVAAPQALAPVVVPERKPVVTPVAAAPARVEPEFVQPRVEEHARHAGYGDDMPGEPVAAAVPVAAEPDFDQPALDAMEAEVDPGRWHETKEPILAREQAPAVLPILQTPRPAEEITEEPALFEVEPAARERWDDEIATEAAAPLDVAAEPEPMLDIDAEPAVFEDLPENRVVAAEPAVPQAMPVAESNALKAEMSRQPAKQVDRDLDELLADVERFPVQPAPVARPVSASRVSTPVIQPTTVRQQEAVRPVATAPAGNQPIVPAVEPKADVAGNAVPAATPAFGAKPAALQPQRSIVTAAVAEVEKATPRVEAAAPTIAKVVETASQPAAFVGKSAEPVAKAVEPAENVAKAQKHHADTDDLDVFDESAFELDLTEIELDMLEMEVASSVAPALHEDHVTASEAALADMADAPIATKPPVSPERRAEPQPRAVEDYSSLPFDPSQIVGEEDPVLAIAEMDVPETPAHAHEEHLLPSEPDYDIDIDAEMAHIFSRPTERAAASAAKTGQPAQASPLSSTDLDEFERALEEDFRRSLSENRATSTPDRVALTPASYDSAKREGSTGRRILVLAASVAGLVLIGGAGVYAYWGNSGRLLTTSGDPKIILADKDPVKVEPKDRGGQIVPNQDKAVYDRVSGETKELTKQDRLVTSNEEPVDVVQKTLMPENLPQDDDQSAATDTTDTTDPRLLPDQQDNNVSTDAATDTVSPRKVRTMVVRSDGTLVPRDEQPATAKDQTPAEQSQDRSLDITPASTDNVPERLTANDDIAKQIKEANADKSFVPEAKQPADATDTSTENADAKTPVTADQPAATEDDTAKTADQTTQDQATTTDQSATATDPAATATDQSATDDGSSDPKPDIVPVKKQDLAAATPSDDTANTAADTSTNDATSGQPAADTTQSDDAVQATRVKTTALRSNTPIPASRPVDQPVDIVGRVTDQGNVQNNQEMASAEPTDQSVQTTTTPAGAYVIQIASLPSEAEAQKSYTKLSARFAGVIGGHGVDIRKAAIKNKGTYYRVRIVAGTRQEAADLCSRYKAAGGSCLVSR